MPDIIVGEAKHRLAQRDNQGYYYAIYVLSFHFSDLPEIVDIFPCHKMKIAAGKGINSILQSDHYSFKLLKIVF